MISVINCCLNPQLINSADFMLEIVSLKLNLCFYCVPKGKSQIHARAKS